ncbi:uncharacterized protein L201_006896 [Kwoniella dendrophila CBS 6074]|uniref:Major facilitator superfamily (MFS) profile domain-containing protein n=1 Tax=Kwoniella dendrophila CBS 6074 TaxID=1295534 RepID=A0AAX4K4A3_9TREE
MSSSKSSRPTLRPNPSISSMTSSSSSTQTQSTIKPDHISHAHEQQHNYVPSFDDIGLTSNGITERALFSGNNTPSPSLLVSEQTPLLERQRQIKGKSKSKDTEKQIPEWKKPSPKWLYPFIIGVPLCIGMSIAPKAELYVNLACLAHPPSASKDSNNGHFQLAESSLVNQRVQSENPLNNYMYNGIGHNSYVGIGHDLQANMTVGTGDYVLSPADKWFLKLQRDIYEYRLNHQSNSTKSIPSGRPIILPPSTTSSEPKVEPTSPLPRPDKPYPSDKDGNEDKSPNENDKTKDNDNHRPYEEIDPRLCKKDAKVQAAAAKLTMMMTLTMGLLSALTTGFWGQTSDKLGRTKIIAVVEIGLLLNEICFIVIANFPYAVPGGYRLLLLGPIIEGLLGGYSTISATLNAYVSDITPDGSRVTIFARISGIFMAGFAVGPVLGSLLISWTGNIMTPFYVNAIVYTLYIPLLSFLLPESLSFEAREELAKKAKTLKEEAKKRDELEREWENETPFINNNNEDVDPLLSGWSRMSSFSTTPNQNNQTHSKRRKKLMGKIKRSLRKLFGFLEPLTIFIPTKHEENDQHRDWNLTVVGAALFFMSMIFGIMSIKAQYTFYAFGWTSTQLGPYMSVTAFSRSFVLIVLVPIVMHYVKPRFLPNEDANPVAQVGDPAIDEEVIESVLHNDQPSSTQDIENQNGKVGILPSESKLQPKRSAHLDLYTVRISLLLETIPYIFLSLSPSPIGFIFCSILTTLGGPSNPAANSLALSLLKDPNQSGRLFGALSVLHALGANLLSPLLFGTIFASTVGTYAATIFILAAVSLVLAQICVSFVRLDKKSKSEIGQEENEIDGVRRGRSRRVKSVNSSSSSSQVQM